MHAIADCQRDRDEGEGDPHRPQLISPRRLANGCDCCCAAQSFQVHAQLARRLVAAIGIFVHCLQNHGFEGGRDLAIHGSGRGGWPIQNRFHQQRSAFLLEWCSTCGHLVKHRAGGINVAAWADFFALEVLGWDIWQSSADSFDGSLIDCHGLCAWFCEILCQAEIQNL